MTISITNMSRMPFTVSLYHDSYCADSGSCKCKCFTAMVPVASDDGVQRSQFVERRVPETLYVAPRGMPGSTVEGLNDAVLQIPQVKVARKRRALRVTLSPTVTPTTKAAPVAPNVPPTFAAPAPTRAIESGNALASNESPRSSRRATRNRS